MILFCPTPDGIKASPPCALSQRTNLPLSIHTRSSTMQLSVVFAALSALIATAVANPVAAPRAGFSLAASSEDGAYRFDQHGNITSFVSAATLKRSMEARGLGSVTAGEESSAELTKRGSTGTNCFNAKFSGGDKLNAVNAMFSLLDDYPVIPANGGIATQFGESSFLYSLSAVG